MRHEGQHVRFGFAERTRKQGGSTLTINVVIAVNQNAPTGLHRLHNDLNRTVDSEDAFRVRKIGQLGPQVTSRSLDRIMPPLDQQCG